MQLPYLAGDRMRRELRILDLVEALRRGHRDPIPEMERVLMSEAGTPNAFLVWHAWAPQSTIAVKLTTVFPANPGRTPPLPTVQAVITAFDGATGAPAAILDGTELTYWKTAASSGLAADYLAPPSPHTLLVVGAGGLAPYLAMAHRAVRPSIDRVLVWNRTVSKAEALLDDPRLGGGSELAVDLDAAVPQADVITTCTGTFEPLIRGRLLKPGTHVDLVGGFTPEMREADDEAVRRAAVFVDAAMFTIEHAGDVSVPIATGVIRRDDVQADLFGLCRGEHPGRTSPDEITLYKSAGGAHLDLMATRHALEVLS